MFNPTREEVRRFFCDTWAKVRDGTVLTPLEHVAAEWIEAHPEYHTLLSDADRSVAQDYTPDHGVTNPFLHLSMHLSISEQITIDQPGGIKAASQQLEQRLDSRHEAQHQIMECLGEMLWQSQRDQAAPDGAAYIACVERRARR